MDRIENIDYCIRYLLKQNHARAEIPHRLHEKKELLRALMNIWSPQPLDIEFLQAQDAELQAQKKEKGVVSLKDISARLKQTFKGAYKEDQGTFEKLGHILRRPDYPFESRRKAAGQEYWVKERE